MASWERYAGSTGAIVGMKTFGASAPLKDLLKFFGFQSWNGKPIVIVPDKRGGFKVVDIARSLGPGLMVDEKGDLVTTGLAPDLEMQNAITARAQAAELLLSMGNPKIMLFYLALMPTLIDLTQLTFMDMAELAAIVALVVSVVLAGYVLLASQARRMFTSPRAVQAVNRTAGLAMAGAAAAIVARN